MSIKTGSTGRTRAVCDACRREIKSGESAFAELGFLDEEPKIRRVSRRSMEIAVPVFMLTVHAGECREMVRHLLVSENFLASVSDPNIFHLDNEWPADTPPHIPEMLRDLGERIKKTIAEGGAAK